MAQTTYSAAPPKAADFDYVISQLPGGIKSIEIDNGSALTLTVVADGQVVRTIAAYVARFCLNTSGAWDQVIIKRNNATIQATDSLTIVAYDGLVIPPLLPSFGPAAWGAGAVPNILQAVSAGDQFLSWQVQQLINLLTGVMTGQPVKISNTMEVVGVVTADLNVVVGSGSKNAAIPSPALEVQAVTVPGEVSISWYNGGGVAEWRWRQPAGSTGNWSDFGTQIGAAFTQMLRVYPSGGVYIGNAPADPGANNLWTQKELGVVNAGAVFIDLHLKNSVGDTTLYLDNLGNYGVYNNLVSRSLISFDVTTGIARLNNKMFLGTPDGAPQASSALSAGPGAPNNSGGTNGDFYFRSDGGALTSIYQKRAGAWVGIV